MSSALSSSTAGVSRRRRNGRKAACEPCRKSRIGCDHQIPRCGQCVRLGKGAECFVHNAPMTSRKSPHDWNNPAQPLDSPAGAWGGRGRHSSVNPVGQGDDREVANAQILFADTAIKQSQTQQVAAILLTLREHEATVKGALEIYYGGASAALVPGRFTLAIADSLPDYFARSGIDATEGGQLRARRCAVEILDATAATPWKPSTTTTVFEFVSMWSGFNIRLQALGLVCAMAGRSMLYELADCTEGQPQGEIIHTMLRLSAWCLAIVREIAPAVTDLQIWHAFENLHLYTALNTYRHPSVSMQMGQLIAESYLLGINREQKLSSDVPFFLAELRRRTFAMVYHLDKSISIWHECPVRMPRSGSDTKMPLDLHDKDLLVDGEFQMTAARVQLSHDGWNESAPHNFHTNAWARIRYLLGPIREQISECSFFPRPLSGEHIRRLEDLTIKSQEVWKSLPSHLQYAPSCWESSLSRGICTMLALVHLNYLQLIFHVQRILYAGSDRGEIHLLEASLTLLTTVLDLGTVPNRRVLVRHEYDFVLLGHGVLSAAALTSMLADSARNTSRLYAITSRRGAIIRQLSVFASRLDTVFTPDNANKQVASEASLAVTQVLDQILHAEQGTLDASHDRQFPTGHVKHVPSIRGTAINEADKGDMLDEHACVREPSTCTQTFDLQGLDDWMEHIGWTAMGDEPYSI